MPRPPALRRAVVVALPLALASLLSGCSSGPTDLPDDVTVSVFQNRFDYSLRQIEIKVANGTDAPITVTAASLVSTRWTTPAVWDRPQEIPSGSARDLKVLLGDPDCSATDLVDTIELEITLEDGSTATGTVTPTDETDRLPTVYEQDCLAADVAGIAGVTAPDSVDWTPGSQGTLSLDITVTPTGAEGAVTFLQAKGTVLVGLVDESGAPIDVLPLDRVVDASSGSSVIPLLIRPNRCDPHAVAEDKRGTFMPLDVSTDDGRAGTIYVAMSDAVRLSIYEYIADYCAFP